jgi:hypothetical protein
MVMAVLTAALTADSELIYGEPVPVPPVRLPPEVLGINDGVEKYCVFHAVVLADRA